MSKQHVSSLVSTLLASEPKEGEIGILSSPPSFPHLCPLKIYASIEITSIPPSLLLLLSVAARRGALCSNELQDRITG